MTTTPTKFWQSALGRYLSMLLLFNPGIVAVVTLVINRGGNLVANYLISLAVATVVSSWCFGGILLLRRLEVWAYGRLGSTAPSHGAVSYVLLSMFLCAPGLFLAFRLVTLAAPRLGFEWREPRSFGVYSYGLFLGALIAVPFILWYMLSEARGAASRAELQAKEAEARRLQAQLSALAAQLNPHLLFNALNTVAALIETDPKRCEAVLIKLADLYRGVLAASRKATHSLADELHLCQAYLDVESARFEERLRAHVVVSPGLSADELQVPVLLLQPLVENAVRHGISGRASGGAIEVRARADGDDAELTVEDDGVGLGNSTAAGEGAGLTTCRERLRLRYDGRASFEIVGRASGGTRVVLRLPTAG
jgi:signal transduction histidine kinase